MKGCHIHRGEGDGTTFYFGRHRGARFIGIGLAGFSGWQSYPKWMPGGWEFFTPHLHIGRLFTDETRWWDTRLLLPAKLVGLWRMRRRSYREALNEKPIAVEIVDKGWR